MKLFLHRHPDHAGKIGSAFCPTTSGKATPEPLKPNLFHSSPAVAFGALALGALAAGAFAIGVLSIGKLVLGKVFVGSARIKKLSVDELIIGRSNTALFSESESEETDETDRNKHKQSL
ncbi:hypothetical protein [Chlorobium phaeobacteroides]|jgi:hypothetical protein|uniref:Uncharacterized protein n=1 Tax=Chlorobium phaeobacteroides (strain DSM 266 / SMG 266 / 2430) TaxID=290317 RepID=A1BHR0_CHLPD|nr:hypothetical protein [Chlorobium phaeobacteroides]ABL65937.1 hypothetical protein Cpha266_1921 [Chlorobium phaeobacteroides DSM 266]MBV5327712.1 hypothetical protein [Chlorobium sp.]